MSASGLSPRAKRLRLTPQSADPVNPAEGDVFHSNGTPRAEGPWVYQNGAWQQFSTSGAISIVNDLTFDPQPADPGSPTEGMVFYSDGTSREAGLWIYDGIGWVQLTGDGRSQEFAMKDYVEIRVASTANVTLASGVENGDTIDGVVLATGDKVLLKNQTTNSENGVWVVQVSGSPVRDVSADTGAELTYYAAAITEGTANRNTVWFQNNIMSALSDPQSWATTITAQNFTVPEGVYEVKVLVVGAGGSGGGGAGGAASGGPSNGFGGGAGAAAPIIERVLAVTPGEVIPVQLGKGGLRVNGGTAGTGTTGNAGASTTITALAETLTAPGGNPGTGGSTTVAGIGGSTTPINTNILIQAGGDGGGLGSAPDGQNSVEEAGGNGGVSTGNGTHGGGGGGGAALEPGGDGGNGVVSAGTGHSVANGHGQNANKGAGGGGGGGGGNNNPGGGSRTGGKSGHGGVGYAKFSWN